MSKKNDGKTVSEKEQLEAAKKRKKDLRAIQRILRKAETVEETFDELADDIQELMEETERQFGNESQPFDDIELVAVGVSTDFGRLLMFQRFVDGIKAAIEETK